MNDLQKKFEAIKTTPEYKIAHMENIIEKLEELLQFAIDAFETIESMGTVESKALSDKAREALLKIKGQTNADPET
jgi:hypothetical protein